HLDLVAAFDAVRMVKTALVEGGQYNVARADEGYERAFERGSLGRVGDDPEAVAARIRDLPVREQVVAALDDWAASIGRDEEARLAWVLEVARRADVKDAWRERFRSLKVWHDRTALEKLADEARLAELSPWLLTALGERLRLTGGDPRPLLRRATDHY